MTTEKKVNEISRRSFMKGVGKSIAGVTLFGGVGGLLTALEPPTASAHPGGTPQWPFPYAKLDPEKVKARSYKGYKEKGGWGVGVAEGFFGTLADEVGYPFNQVPPEAFIHGAAGYGMATLCGSLGVAAACIGMVTDAATQKKLVGELFSWYKEHDFPHYQPKGLGLKQTVAESVLCYDSVGKFMEIQGCGFGDMERKERCAGVAAEIAGKVVELLNETVA